MELKRLRLTVYIDPPGNNPKEWDHLKENVEKALGTRFKNPVCLDTCQDCGPWCATCGNIPLKYCQHSQYVEAVEKKQGGVIPPIGRKEAV